LNEGCRRWPSRVQAVNSTSATRTGSTQRASRASARGTSTNGDSGRRCFKQGDEFATEFLAEAGSDLAGVVQFAVAVVADQQGAEPGCRRPLPAADHELPLWSMHLAFAHSPHLHGGQPEFWADLLNAHKS
jgi:hypothetical protein